MPNKLLLSSTVILFLLTACQSSDSGSRRLEGVALGDIDYQEIRFPNDQQNLDLGGMLLIPEGSGPFDAAVIIHGSGTSRRDNSWYLTLADYLRNNSTVVLLPDKRGSEKSGGNWQTASFSDLATDTEAALGYLRQQDRFAINRLGIIGLSQGGHIAPLVADRDQNLDFLVNMVGSALPMHTGLVYEESHNLREAGIPGLLADVLAYPGAWSLIYLRQREFWSAIGNFDPAPYWQDLNTTAFVLYGDEDTNVPTSRSVERLESFNNPNILIRVYEGSGHSLESPPGSGNSTIRLDALRDIEAFIKSAGR